MSHFAHIDANGIVDSVIVADQSFIDSGVVGPSNEWVQTSYNGLIRKNYAGIGHAYDRARDAFVPPKPHESFVFDEQAGRWKEPLPYPDDGREYVWHEPSGRWKLMREDKASGNGNK